MIYKEMIEIKVIASLSSLRRRRRGSNPTLITQRKQIAGSVKCPSRDQNLSGKYKEIEFSN
jgi:hypothetical protein